MSEATLTLTERKRSGDLTAYGILDWANVGLKAGIGLGISAFVLSFLFSIFWGVLSMLGMAALLTLGS